MKSTTAHALFWIATAFAVSVAVLITNSATPLWAMLIPALMSSGGD